jgi:hypothetical protein
VRAEHQASSPPITMIGYTIFDAHSLSEMGIDPSRLGLQVLVSVSNPAEFADVLAAEADDSSGPKAKSTLGRCCGCRWRSLSSMESRWQQRFGA